MSARFVDVKLGATSDGMLTAIQAHTLLDHGGFTGGATIAANSFTAPFDTLYSPNIDVTVSSGLTNTYTRQAYRGYGNTKQTTSINITADQLIEQMGMNPMDFYSANVIKTGDPVCKRNTDPLNPLSSCGFTTQIPNLRKSSNWDAKWHKPGALTLPNGNLHGIGMACRMHWAAMMPNGSYSSAYVKVNHDGSVYLYVATPDIGGGQTTAEAMICAETLGVPLSSVNIAERGDTMATPYGNGTYSSQTTYVTGNAVISAANDAKQQLLVLGAAKLGVAVTDVNIKNGTIYAIDNPSNNCTITSAITFSGAPYYGQVHNILGRGSYVEVGIPFSSGVAVVEVEVDPGTGEIIIDNFWGSTDTGFSINPGMCELQEQGGEVMGVGYVLSEAWVLDPASGKVLTMGPLNDRVVAIAPNIYSVDQAQPVDPNGPYGAVGMGEPGLMTTPGAILNAVYNATGVRFLDLPLTPDKVLLGLGKYSGTAFSEIIGFSQTFPNGSIGVPGGGPQPPNVGQPKVSAPVGGAARGPSKEVA